MNTVKNPTFKRRKGLHLFILYIFVALLSAARSEAQESFYKGKIIRIIVPFSPGGGYDIYSRVLARHIGKHIAGNPVLVVENTTGAGGLIGTNYVYKVAKPDGLTIGHPIGSLFLQQLVGKPGIEFDARKFEYIGAPAQDTQLLTVHKRTEIGRASCR